MHPHPSTRFRRARGVPPPTSSATATAGPGPPTSCAAGAAGSSSPGRGRGKPTDKQIEEGAGAGRDPGTDPPLAPRADGVAGHRPVRRRVPVVAAAVRQCPVPGRDAVGAGAAQKKSGDLIVEADELWSFVGSEGEQWWVWAALDADTRQVVAMVAGDRSEATARCLWDALPDEYQAHAVMCTDFWSAYLAAGRSSPARISDCGDPGRSACGRRQGRRADQPHRAVLVHPTAAVRPPRAEDAVVLPVRPEPRRGDLVLRPSLQRLIAVGPLPPLDMKPRNFLV